ncbi:hypothetical protein SCLCIDRAFT_995783 [Scleroderma citrinum Foug A]|uniref:Uncharacterized protein n=1 Tax=Scleroderma citrinum Foug A TaxID=1036808 RepID=A0A0C3A4D4_9AGAM|nr:hypothetical protein SCLCIDRAFT_995783 [Scleroderma citrinum Foug A]
MGPGISSHPWTDQRLEGKRSFLLESSSPISAIAWVDDRKTIEHLMPICHRMLSCLLARHAARNDMPYPRVTTTTGPHWGVCFSTHIRRRPAEENQSPQLRLLFRSSICVQFFGCHQFGREGKDTIPQSLVTI